MSIQPMPTDYLRKLFVIRELSAGIVRFCTNLDQLERIFTSAGRLFVLSRSLQLLTMHRVDPLFVNMRELIHELEYFMYIPAMVSIPKT